MFLTIIPFQANLPHENTLNFIRINIMSYRNYQVLVFDEKSGAKHTCRVNTLGLCVLFTVVAFLACGNVFLWKHFMQTRTLENQLLHSEQELDLRENHLIAMLAELDSLRDDIYRIRQYDNKLRVLVGDEGTRGEQEAIGGVAFEAFNASSLPLHRQELAARKVRSFIRELKKEVQLEELAQQDLVLHMQDNVQALAATPSIWPTQGFITSKFGGRDSPFTGVKQLHRGLDIGSPTGTPIVAPANGRVVFSQTDGGYGLSIEIDHGSGVRTKYAHMSKLIAHRGKMVKRGEIIGVVGNTGRSTGSHLHYEVLVNGVPTNPMKYIVQD